MFSDFFGDTISRLVKDSGEKVSDVACNMCIDPRSFGYIRSKADKRHRHITFWETLRFIVVIDLPINDGLNLLHLCGYCLCRQRVRDKIIFLTLNAKNTTVFEMNARLDILFALEYNEPLNSNRYNYRALFEHVKKIITSKINRQGKIKPKGEITMSKNIYIEEYSGQYDTFDYFISADVENSGNITITAFLNHDRISFHQLLADFKNMLCSIKANYRNTKYDGDESKTTPDCKEFEVKMSPDDNEVIVILYHADFDTESLIESFAYAVGYVQSFMLHRIE